MKTPKFWDSINVVSILLIPLGLLYFVISKLAYLKLLFKKRYVASVPVICVGNITAGGAGKTPTVIFLCEMFAKKGKKVAVLSRGYKASLSSKKCAIKVDVKRHLVSQVGDEPMLIALKTNADVYICPDRAKSAAMAEKNGADVIIMDDGMQNHSIKKDFKICVFNGRKGVGNEFILPAGPLREPYNPRKIDVSIVIDRDEHMLKERLRNCISARIQVADSTIDKKEKYFAFAGIAIPEKFLNSCLQNGINVVESKIYSDHYSYKRDDILELATEAKKFGARLITTEKDFVRIPKGLEKYVYTLPVRLDISSQDVDVLEDIMLKKNVIL